MSLPAVSPTLIGTVISDPGVAEIAGSETSNEDAGVAVGVKVAVKAGVAVFVALLVGVFVGVFVDVAVLVAVNVGVLVGVAPPGIVRVPIKRSNELAVPLGFVPLQFELSAQIA